MFKLPNGLSAPATASAYLIKREFPLVTEAAPADIWGTLARKFNGTQYGPTLRAELPKIEAGLKAGTLSKLTVGNALWHLCGRGPTAEEKHNVGKKAAEQAAGTDGGRMAQDAMRFKAADTVKRLEAAMQEQAPVTQPANRKAGRKAG